MDVYILSMDYLLLIFLSVFALGAAVGSLFCHLWLSRREKLSASKTEESSYLIVDEHPSANDYKNLELEKKDVADRQRLKTSTPDWEDF